MAKCPICSTRKGKRKCLVNESFICSLCCASSRAAENCSDCNFYQAPSSNRNYYKLPHYHVEEMSSDIELRGISELIERALCIVDDEHKINDSQARQILERLLDRYHFDDEQISFDHSAEQKGFAFVSEHLNENFSTIPKETIVKIIGSVLRSIKRHKQGSRGYLDFIHQFIAH